MIDLERVRPDPEQPRREFIEEEMKNLTASIVERGIMQPVRVWFVENAEMYQIISGERRYRAAVAAGLKELPCIIEDAPGRGQVIPRKEILVDQVVENWQREDLNPYDLSDALKELRDDHGLSQDEIARLTSKPKSEISRFLAMQRVTAEVQKKIRGDVTGKKYSRRHVVAISRLPPTEQPALAEKIETEKLSAVQTEREVKRHKRRQSGQSMSGAPVTIRRYSIGSTKIQISFRKKHIEKAEILQVLDRVRGLVEGSAESGEVGE